jgi:hypothetical protein
LSSPANLRAFLSLYLKCAHLVPAKTPLPEEAIFNQNKAATEKRHAARKAQHKKRQIAKRDHNDNRNKRQKAGGLASPPMNTCRLSRRGAEMSPVRRSTRATCRGRPRRRLPAALKCHRRASHRRLGATRPWARSRVRRLPPSERTSGRSAPCGAQRDGCFRVAEICAPPSRSPEKVGGAAGARPPAL